MKDQILYVCNYIYSSNDTDGSPKRWQVDTMTCCLTVHLQSVNKSFVYFAQLELATDWILRRYWVSYMPMKLFNLTMNAVYIFLRTSRPSNSSPSHWIFLFSLTKWFFKIKQCIYNRKVDRSIKGNFFHMSIKTKSYIVKKVIFIFKWSQLARTLQNVSILYLKREKFVVENPPTCANINVFEKVI